MARSLGRFWRVLRDVDTAWLLGPYALSILFAGLAALRRRRVALGVRQDLPRYVRSRHPDRRWVHLAADVLEGTFRALARRWPVVVVGPDLARRYGRARRVLPITVSLVPAGQIASESDIRARSYDGDLVALSVGRLEHEKNPLLLADVLARLREHDPRWRLVVAGEGPLEPDLRARLRELGVEDAADVRGYVPIDGGLPELYRSSHAFLHVSWTEGLPQVLFEAFAAGLPVVATDVGGVDAERPARELARLGADPELRMRLVAAGLRRVREHTLEAESRRVAEFLAE
jgi:glycosyltransferase involved in cell wall biosynthesis